MNSTISFTTTTKVYYGPLVRWEKVDEIVFSTQPHEHPKTRELIMRTLDHAVLEAILHELDEAEHHAFLELCEQQYEDETLLDWLEERVEDIRDTVQKVIRSTKAELKELLTHDSD